MYSIKTFSERNFIGNLFKIFAPPKFSSTKEWLESNIVLTSEQTADPGPLDTGKTPWLAYFLEVLDDPNIKLIVGCKSSRIAWSTVINGYIGKKLTEDKVNVGLCFAKADSRVEYYKSFLLPMLRTTPILYQTVTKYSNFKKLNHKHIKFDNCNLRLLNMGTPTDTKTSFFTNIIVEEPDEVKADVGGQGNALSLVQDRKKTSDNYKIIVGGTPTDANFSQVFELAKQVNMHHFEVDCPSCGKSHLITKREAWENLKFDPWPDGRIDEIYGQFDPFTIRYECPHCLDQWSFEQKNQIILKSLEKPNYGWIGENPAIENAYGFQFNELLSNFPGCHFLEIGKALLKAKKEYDEGSEGEMKKFVNTKMGFAYSPLHTGVNVDELIARRLSYSEGIVPKEGLILTCAIDKQRGGKTAKSRFELTVRAWGRNGNSWLVKYDVIEGNTQDYSDNVWERLSDYVCNTEFPHESSLVSHLKISGVAIDSADDSEIVYRWVHDMTKSIDENGNHIKPKFESRFGPAVFAVRGSSDKYDQYEIYNPPAVMEISNDAQARRSLAQRMGVDLYIVGSFKSHDELQRRINLEGSRDRFFHCKTSLHGYERSLLSCTKTYGGYDSKGYWKQIPGWPKEVRDCERYNIWLQWALQINQYTNVDWNAIEFGLTQGFIK